MKNLLINILVIVYFFNSGIVSAQTQISEKSCFDYMDSTYISDGQQYRALLNGDEVSEFNITFYGGNQYRIVACGADEDDNIVFTVYDQDHNLLFSNLDYDAIPYWDFKFTSTVNCTIEAKLNTNVKKSGIAMLYVGFKR